MSIVIYPPTIDWTWMKQRPQHLMSRLAAAGHTVFYCNRTQSDAKPMEIEPNLYLVCHHEHWLRREWPAFRKQRKERVIAWCSLPFQSSSVRGGYDPDIVVYDCADDCPEWYPHEKEMAEAADLILCSSGRLLDRLNRSYPGKRIRLVRNGYDTGLRLHEEENCTNGGGSAGLATPRKIGYIGAWAPWIDTALIRDLSVFCDAEIVMVGPEFGRKFWPENAASRVRFSGLKRHDQLPGYIRDFSVCIIPFRATPIALAANPIKAYEYLAAGKPVISTMLPECRFMEPHVDVAATRREFVRAVEYRLAFPGNAGERRRFALDNTWAHRGKEIAAHLEALEQP